MNTETTANGAARSSEEHFEVLIVGGGAGGVSAAASLLKRKPDLRIAIIDMADEHFYQPGWTLVGCGVFEQQFTARPMASVIPRGVQWIKAAVSSFDPENNALSLDNSRKLVYDRLIVAPGLKLDWEAIEGLPETLGENGVTSNYRYDLAPYTWKLVQGLKSGRALFTQPPMPIKCAGAPQKAMYLSADHWYNAARLGDIDIEFFTAGPVLFGVKDYVPALMQYVQKYQITLNFSHNLVRVDGPARKAWFERTDESGGKETIESSFDMLHVCPPQQAPDFVRNSPLADSAGWVDVDQETLQHRKYANIWSLGDVMNAPNAKTAAAVRKQAPVVAHNILADMKLSRGTARYDGYGSCPLTVERGRIVLAEFGYGGRQLPTFPPWLIDGTRPSRMAWVLKKDVLPTIYWNAMLRGKEWMVAPDVSE